MKKHVLMLARVNSIAYLCSTETRNATAHAACDSNNPTGHRALPDYTETRERSGKSACLLHSHKPMYNLSNFGEYYTSKLQYNLIELDHFQQDNIFSNHCVLFVYQKDEDNMKKLLIMIVATLMAAISASAQNIPVGMRMEIAEAETDNSEYSVFTYKDEDETFGYYLGLGRVINYVSIFRDDITDMSFEDIKETCICLGGTYDEAYAMLDAILDLFDRDVETTVEFQGRAATGSGRLGEPNTSTCVVKKKPLGGKRLLFLFTCGKRQAETCLTKSVVKELRMGLKMDKKLHPKQHR